MQRLALSSLEQLNCEFRGAVPIGQRDILGLEILAPQPRRESIVDLLAQKLQFLYLLDLREGKVMVRRTVTRDVEGHFTVGTPKSKHSKRAIAISRLTTQTLFARRQRQLEQRFKLGPGYEDNDFVFIGQLGGMLSPNTLTNRFHALQARTGNPRLRVHDLRHTAATLMLTNNVHPKVVSEMLGHANVMITLDLYSHVTMTLQRQAADLLEASITEAMRHHAADILDASLRFTNTSEAVA